MFRRFLLGAMFGSVGGFLQGTAQGWLVLDLTNSATALGVVSALQVLPILFLSAWAGVIADKVDRRRLLAGTQLFAAVLAVVLAVLSTTGLVEYWHVAVLALLAGTASAFQNPALQAIVPSLVPREAIGSAVALNAAQFNLSRILGPALAGAAIAAGGLALAFWGNALALLGVTVILFRLRVPAATASSLRVGASMWGNLLEGVRYVRRSRVVAVLVLLAAIPGLFLLNYLLLLPVYARDVLGIGAPGLGMLSAGIGVGALTGALGLASLRPSGGSGRALLAGLVIASLAEIVYATSRWLPVSVVALGVLGGCQVLYYATTNTLLQVLVEARLRGRVMSLYIVTSWGFIPIGNVLAGAAAEHIGPTVTLVGGSLLTLAIGLAVAVLVPELWRLEARTGQAAPEAPRPGGPEAARNSADSVGPA